MINTRMTIDDVYKKFDRDLVELTRRTKSYLQSKNKGFKERWKRTGNGEITLVDPRCTVISGNRYKQSLTVSYSKKGWTSYKATTYIFIQDCTTGKIRVWMFVREKKTILEFSPKFLKEAVPGKTYLEAADEYMKNPTTYHFYQTPTGELEAVIGDNLIGFGKINNGFYILEKLFTPEEIEEMEKELGKEGDPLEIYKEWSAKENEISLDGLEGEELKKAEIELAWKELAIQ